MSYTVVKKIRKNGKVVKTIKEIRDGNLYNVSSDDIKNIDEKIRRDKQFIEFNNLPCYDFAINPKKYYYELQSRLKTFVEKCQNLKLVPVFITITLPSRFHDLNKYDVPFLIKTLNKYFDNFKKSRVFTKRFNLSSKNFKFFRVVEPHKSGVPHYHILAFVPANVIISLKKYFFHYFVKVVGSNKKSLDFRYKFVNKKGSSGALQYMLKYMQKFRNTPDQVIEFSVSQITGEISKVENGLKSVSLVMYWYKKYSVRKFSFSRVLVPIIIYRKLYKYFKFRLDSMYRLTQMFHDGRIVRKYITELVFDDYEQEYKKRKYLNKIFVIYDNVWVQLYDRYKSAFDYRMLLKYEWYQEHFINSIDIMKNTIYNLEKLDIEKKVMI